NAVKAALEPFDADRHVATVEAMMAAFDAGFFDRLAPVDWRPAFTPVFILGLPRTGTTLVEQILAHYPSVHAGGERIPLRAIVSDAIDAPAAVAARDGAWARGQAE